MSTMSAATAVSEAIPPPPPNLSGPNSATVAEMGAHDMIVGLGDCQLFATCACGKVLGAVQPDEPFETLLLAWERHIITDASDYGDPES